YTEIKLLTRKLALSLSKEEKKSHSLKRPKDAFTRFSVSNLSSVIDSLTPDQKKIIDNFGFGSLLHFDKCFVPNKFAQWVARLVNHRSGDIVIDGKVISLTKQSVHLVLGLPISDKPFPVNPATGKAVVLSKFGKKSIPPVSFFANKFLDKEPMSDEEVLICFILVAMHSFLCANSSVTPSYKYFGIFEDLHNAKQYDWCGYILDWLLDCVKTFNRGKCSKDYDGGTLGGCLYYLAVLYLDHVDFGARQVSDNVPRITVWKGGMIQEYAEFDMKSTGSYGYHPLLDHSHTCYAKDLRFLDNPSALNLDESFLEKLDSFSGCNLPLTLKNNICCLIQKFCFNCGVSINMNVQSINSLPDDLKATLCALLKHVYSIDSHSKNLVLDLIKLLADSFGDDDLGTAPSGSGPHGNSPVFKDDGEINADPVSRSLNKKYCHSNSKPLESDELNVKTPLSDSNNHVEKSVSFGVQAPASNDIIMLDAENRCVPDSVSSPSPRPSLSRLASLKKKSGKENVPPDSANMDQVIMQTLDFTPHSSDRIDSRLPKPRSILKSQAWHSKSCSQKRSSPDVQILGEPSLEEDVLNMSRKAEQLYNSNLQVSAKTPNPVTAVGICASAHHFTGGKQPLHGPRRLAFPGPVLHGDFVTNIRVICKLLPPSFKGLAYVSFTSVDAVNLFGVCCTFWCLGESLKPGGQVKSFIVSAFCFSLFQKPNGHPDTSKRHYFFPNIGENLLKDIDDADQDILGRAFIKSSKARPLKHSNLLVFPTCFEDHWFVFIVDIKDKKYVMLDSYYKETDEFQEIVRERMRDSFEHHWKKILGFEMGFDDYDFMYPVVPEQPLDNNSDSGIYAMMFIEHWTSPRTLLTSVFTSEDIPNIRIKIANDLVFQPKNTGMKHRVTHFNAEI
ncbi:hypothetical protein PVAP13_5NG270440, partial [Panicum virgatum]